MNARTHCPLCHAPAPVLFARPYAGPELQAMLAASGFASRLGDRAYEVRGCAGCDLHFQTWVLEDSELASWYSPPADDATFLAEIGRQKLHWFAHMVEEVLLVRQLCARPRPVVLDFGCNWGKWASVALALGCEVQAVEVNEAAAAFCERRGIRRVFEHQLAEATFDFINVDQVLEHLSDPLGVTQRLAGALRPGGFLKLSTPGNPRLPRRLAAAQASGDCRVLDPKALDALAPLEHVNLFTARSLQGLAGRVGLERYRIPLLKSLGAGQLWNLPRQLNRNLVVPFKRWFNRSTYQWFRKPAA